MSAAILIAIFASLFIAIILPLALSGQYGKAEEEKACARRIKEAKMNARLLRLNL